MAEIKKRDKLAMLNSPGIDAAKASATSGPGKPEAALPKKKEPVPVKDDMSTKKMMIYSVPSAWSKKIKAFNGKSFSDYAREAILEKMQRDGIAR